MEEVVQITTTADKREVVEKIGRSLVEKRLASCAQVLGPVKSIYHWKGRIEEAQEWLCLIKSRKELYHEIEAEILRLHPYELQEIIMTAIDGGLQGYIQWVIDETSA